MDWDSLSEICFGLLVKGKLAPDAVRSEFFQAPFDAGVELIKAGNSAPEFLIPKIGTTAFGAGMEACEQVAGTKADWASMLERAYRMTILADSLDRTSRKLRKGEEFEFSKIVEQFNLLEHDQVDGVPMSQVTEEPDPFQKLGWTAIDEHFQGIPKVGLITVGGSTGSGKTTFAIKLIYDFLRTHKKKTVSMFTLEMPAREFKARAMTINKVPTDIQDRFIMFDEIMAIEELSNKASKHADGNGMVVIDFADLLIKNETNESEMATIYRTCAIMAKRLLCPVVLLSQLNYMYNGGIPRPNCLRYTRLAEALSWSVWMTYNPQTDFHALSDEGVLPPVDGKGYILQWKCRGGFKYGRPIALQLGWDGAKGWSDLADGKFFLTTT